MIAAVLFSITSIMQLLRDLFFCGLCFVVIFGFGITLHSFLRKR